MGHCYRGLVVASMDGVVSMMGWEFGVVFLMLELALDVDVHPPTG